MAISDSKLDELFEAPTTEVPNPDKIPLSDPEKQVLSLPPKFTKYEDITVSKINASAEALACKLRWEQMERNQREEGESLNEEEEWEKVQAKTVLDEENGTMRFSNRRVTDMKTNRRITIPDTMDENMEIVLANMKSRVVAVGKDYIRKNCDSKGHIKATNLKPEEEVGIKKLLKRIDDEEILVQATDKSGQLAVITPESYISSMQPHIEGNPEISWEDKMSLERELNGHSLQLGCSLKIGDKWNHWPRVKRALRNKFCHIPVLSGANKTHKPWQPGQTLPKQRPVAGKFASFRYFARTASQNLILLSLTLR